jgi:hypothetical protein
VFKLVFALFAAPDKVLEMKNEYLNKKRAYRRWFVIYLSEDKTKLRRRKDDEKDTVTHICAFKQYLKQGIGTRGIFLFEPSPPSSLTYRMKGCFCRFCLSSNSLNLITFEPRQACISAENNPWESQEIVAVREKTDNAVAAAMERNQIDNNNALVVAAAGNKNNNLLINNN